MSMTKEHYETMTAWKMSYEEYCACDCCNCEKRDCPHKGAYRRVPEIDGGLGLCPNLQQMRREKK